MSSFWQAPRHNRHNYTNLSQSCTVHVNDFKQLTTLWWCISTLPQFHENSLKEITSSTTKFQFRTYYKISEINVHKWEITASVCLMHNVHWLQSYMWKHLRYWGFKSFGMWCCVTGQVVSHILKDHVAFRRSRNGLQCLVTEDYRRVYGSHKMTKRQYHRILCTPIKSSYDASGIRQLMYTSRSQTDFMSITRVLAQLSTQLFHMTNLHMN